MTSVCIFSILFSIHFLRCWQGEFVWQSRASLVVDHFLYSHYGVRWFRGDIVRRNQMSVNLRVKELMSLFSHEHWSLDTLCKPVNNFCLFTVYFKINRQNKAQNVKSLGATRQQQRNRCASSIFSCEFSMAVIFCQLNP